MNSNCRKFVSVVHSILLCIRKLRSSSNANIWRTLSTKRWCRCPELQIIKCCSYLCRRKQITTKKKQKMRFCPGAFEYYSHIRARSTSTEPIFFLCPLSLSSEFEFTHILHKISFASRIVNKILFCCIFTRYWNETLTNSFVFFFFKFIIRPFNGAHCAHF